MKRFILPEGSKLTKIGSHDFSKGFIELTDSDAELAEKVLVKRFGCKIESVAKTDKPIDKTSLSADVTKPAPAPAGVTAGIAELQAKSASVPLDKAKSVAAVKPKAQTSVAKSTGAKVLPK